MRNEEIYEIIGAIANAEVLNNGTKITLTKLADILTILEIESNLCDHYQNRTDGLIRGAFDYFNQKGDIKTAQSIKDTYIKSDGTPVIP